MDYVPRRVIIPKLNEIISQMSTENSGYTAEQTDALLDKKADKESVYNVETVDALLENKADVGVACSFDDAKLLLAFQLEATEGGSTVALSDYTLKYPCINVTLKSKNLIPHNLVDDTVQQINGITYTVNEDGSITANGTATASSTFNIYFDTKQLMPIDLLPGEAYTISCRADKPISGCSFAVNYFNEPPFGANYLGWLSVSVGNEKTAEFPSDGITVRIYVNIAAGTTVDNVTLYPILERGRKATGFTPYIDDFSSVTLTVADEAGYSESYSSYADGEVGEITALNDTNFFTTDNESVYIECFYYRDINKAFNALYKKVMFGG